jgi:hypothetical protein
MKAAYELSWVAKSKTLRPAKNPLFTGGNALD